MDNQEELDATKSPEEIQLIKANEKLGKLIELNVEVRNLAVMQCCLLYSICNYKEEQKQGDITYRKKSNKQGLAGIFIAVVAVYISIKAYNGPLMMLIS